MRREVWAFLAMDALIVAALAGWWFFVRAPEPSAGPSAGPSAEPSEAAPAPVAEPAREVPLPERPAPERE